MAAFTHQDTVGTVETVDEVKPKHLWASININDFHASNCWTGVSYAYFWLLVFVDIAVMGADAYTAVVLLAYNRWPGQIAPAIPFNISRWIFAACILFSWVLLAYYIFRAVRVVRRGSVAKDYLDPLAATFQSMRSWRRFLVFAELTKSKKGVDYVALFSYFQFKGAVQTILAEGPRQAINAITLWSAMNADLMNNTGTGTAAISQFATNIRILATTQPAHAAILFTMLFSLVIWVIRALSLIFAALCYIAFLVHYIQGLSLTRYCKAKIERRIERTVDATLLKNIEREESRRQRAAQREARSGRRGFLRHKRSTSSLTSTIALAPVDASPTLPDLEKGPDTLLAPEPSLNDLPSNPLFVPRPPPLRSRTPKMQNRFSKRGVARQPSLSTIEASPRTSPVPFRSNSGASRASDADDRPLLDGALRPDPLTIRRKPVPSLRAVLPVNPHPPPMRSMPARPVTALGRRAEDAPAVPVPQVTPHTRFAGGYAGPTTFDAMGV